MRDIPSYSNAKTVLTKRLNQHTIIIVLKYTRVITPRQAQDRDELEA